jgi:hypothetical protein
MMLGLSESVKRKLNVERVTKLLISSALARQDTKLAPIEHVKRCWLAPKRRDRNWLSNPSVPK